MVASPVSDPPTFRSRLLPEDCQRTWTPVPRFGNPTQKERIST